MLGDARLTLAKSTQQFDLIVLDAFSSDAIPVHLLTREALRGYLARLSPHGVILMHISNRHMELAKVVASVAASEGLVTFGKADDKANSFTNDFRANALVAMLARRDADVGPLDAARLGEGRRAESRALDRRLFRHHGRDPAQEVAQLIFLLQRGRLLLELGLERFSSVAA